MKTTLLFFFFFFTYNSIAQQFGNKEFYLIDSIKVDEFSKLDSSLLNQSLIEFHKAKNDTSAIKWIAEIINNISDNELGEKYNTFLFHFVIDKKKEEGLSKAEAIFYYSVIGTCYSDFGYYESGKGDMSKALNYYYKSIEIGEAIFDTILIARSHINISGLYYEIKDSDQSLDYLMFAKELLDEMNRSNESDDLLLYVLNNIAIHVGDNGEVEESFSYYFEALELCISTGNEFGTGMVSNNLGGVYGKIDSFDLAIKYLKESEKIFIKLENHNWLSLTYQKYGNAYYNIDDFETALFYGNLSYKYAEKSGNVRPKIKASSILTKAYESQGNYKEAFFHYKIKNHLQDSISGIKIKIEALQQKLTYENEKEKAITKKENEAKLKLAEEQEQMHFVKSIFILIGLVLVFLFLIILYYRLKIITKQKKVIEKQNNDRKVLLKEIHHRVKNNFQIICSILSLQADDEDEEKITLAFDDAIDRIHSMSTVHEMIYLQEDFSMISVKEYFEKLTGSMRIFSKYNRIHFDLDIRVESLHIEILIPLGISLNELITNSINPKNSLKSYKIGCKVLILVF